MEHSPIYVIEHLEPEVFEWCVIEYKHISKIVGKNNLWFTNVPLGDSLKLEKFGKVFTNSIKSMQIERACILDPEAGEELTPERGRKFQYFIFGGILGDNPPRKRTKEELTPFLPGILAYNIGKKQMSTDNAVYVTKKIIDGTELQKIPFVDGIEIAIDKIESTQFPYRYAMVKGKPLISRELVKYLKRK